ncbi:MAG: MerR family transcriptional regulator [Deltaproteobacteria bacterium]|nr:MerR family transcriptional regulator [Deltaproteobacteria bacterium]MBN2673453.1 MerR family transcriptional regulator [Deltaproteobacteria bacterium]
MTTRVELPDKLFFKIGEVKDIVGVKQHVLRYWESEFSTIRPQKSKTNQRLYRRKDVEAVLAIKHLLYDRKFTIEGAKQYLKSEGVEASLPPVSPEAVAESARQETIAQMKIEVARAQKIVVDRYEKQLLQLKQDVQSFAAKVESS